MAKDDFLSDEFWQEVLDRFAFLLGQEFAKKAPKDTGKLAKSLIYPSPKIDGNKIIFNPVHYWIFQEFGTYKMKAQPFIRPTLHTKARDLFLKALKSMQ